jgi:hypothetical protein
LINVVIKFPGLYPSEAKVVAGAEAAGDKGRWGGKAAAETPWVALPMTWTWTTTLATGADVELARDNPRVIPPIRRGTFHHFANEIVIENSTA